MVLAYKKSERSSSACRRNCRGSNFFPYMSGRKNLRNLGRITLRTGGEVLENKVQQVLEIVGLENRADDKVGTYSLGMKQRLGIAQALLGIQILSFWMNRLMDWIQLELSSFVKLYSIYSVRRALLFSFLVI